jgi:hypothetical protein
MKREFLSGAGAGESVRARSSRFISYICVLYRCAPNLLLYRCAPNLLLYSPLRRGCGRKRACKMAIFFSFFPGVSSKLGTV